MTRLYPLYHKLDDRPVVVVGGGRVAFRRLGRLLEAGARVTVVAPDVLPEIRALAEAGRIHWKARAYADGDIEGAALTLAASGDLDLARRLRAEAERLGIPFNSAEDESACNFHVPDLVEWGGLRIAISSEGASPALVARLRRELEAWLRDVAPGDLESLRAARLARKASREAAIGEGTAAPSREPPRGGKVYLVGAGPGDPGLLTRRAAEILAAAGVVYHDRLVSAAVLATIPARAEKVYVGKDVGCAHRANIGRLMVESARAGKVVVRLKGGDPVLFGRGGEEMLELSDAGVDFEVVPGVSALCAVPAAVGIPVTYRGIASELVVRSGHTMADEGTLPAERTAGERETTFVYFMAVRRIARVVEDLRAEGLRDSTPVAIVENGTLPHERVITAPLGELVATAEREQVQAPALVIAGEVVRLRERLLASQTKKSPAHATRSP